MPCTQWKEVDLVANQVNVTPPSGSMTEEQSPAAIRVDDEVSPLKRVIVHRPGPEMERLTPPNHKHLLFDDLLSPSQARAEHQQFTELMTGHGSKVMEFRQLFEETLRNKDARDLVITNTANWKRLGPMMAPALIEWISSLPAPELASVCIQGLTKAEWLAIHPTNSLVAQSMDAEDFLIGPLPNHLFTRDASVWAYGGVAVSSMSREARRRESLHYAAIYSHHPMFLGGDFHFWTEGFAGASRSVEGGDILVLGQGCLAVGISERTTPQGVEHLASEMFKAGKADRVLAVMLPKSREFMHLDTVLTQVDHDAFVIYPGALALESVMLRSREGNAQIAEVSTDLPAALEQALGRKLRFIYPQATEAELSREQWNDGFNMLALAPGTVVAYNRTPRSNRAMIDASIEVLEIEGSELGRGRGGPRCMSCPVERASSS